MRMKNTKGQASETELAGLKTALLDVLDEYRDKWPQLLEGKALRVEREGEPIAVVMAFDDFEALLERLEDLEDAEAARDALAAKQNGEETTIPWETLKSELMAEGLLDE